jgi:putative ABC transport system permease protein
MDWHARIRGALTSAGARPDDDVIEELAQHARAVYESARAEGLEHHEAESRVLAQVERWKREAGALRHKGSDVTVSVPPPATSTSWFAGVAQDSRYAFRVLRRQPRFALLVVLTMALGIGSTAVLFNVTYGVLVKPLPWPDGDRLVVLKETRGGNTPRFGSFSNAAYVAWRDQASTIEEIGAWSLRTVTLTGAGDPERIRITRASASLFTVLGVRPLIGSLFSEKDEVTPVVVLSEGLWRQRFGGVPDVLGRTVVLDGEPHTIVGVIADSMVYPDRQSRAWVPFRVPAPVGNLMSMFQVVAKLHPGATVAQAAAEGTARGRFVANTGMTTNAIFGGDGPVEVAGMTLGDAITRDVRRPLIVLLAAVVLLLAIAVANVASLQLARATSRRRELAIRAALGAGRAGAVRPLVLENVLLGIAGGMTGLGLAWLLHHAAVGVLPADFPRLHDLGIDLTIVLLTVAISALASLVFGLVPAFRLPSQESVGTLAEDRMPEAGIRTHSRIARVRLFVLAGQVAIACVLLVAASLLGRSFMKMLHADRGFDPSTILSAVLPLTDASYTPERRAAVVQTIIDRLDAMPTVQKVAFTSEAPLTPGGSTSSFMLPSRPTAGPIQAAPRLVSPGYFAALGLRIIAGRSLEDSDTATSQPVAVVNETFARRYLGDRPLGTAIPRGFWGRDQDATATIVGVVEDIRYVGSEVTSLPEMYFSAKQFSQGILTPVATMLIRSDAPSSLAAAVRSAIREADPALVPASLMTLEDRLLATSLARPRLYAVLLGGFAVIALVVTAVGLFGVLSYSVAQRTHELGIRSALGARRIDLVSLVLRDGFRVVGAGLTIGLFGSGWSARFIDALLYGIETSDPMTYFTVPLVILAVAVLACLAPALRAATLDPLRALRSR